MPNYSHGTAGICDFLLALHVACRKQNDDKYDGRFLRAAEQGAAYLKSLASDPANRDLIPHNFPDGRDLFYLGWCHGPSGTVGFLERLSKISNETAWSKLADKLTRRMIASDIPQQRPPGFWENVGLCCGNAGSASFLLDRYQASRDERAKRCSDALNEDLLRRAERVELDDGKIGLRWTHAEHRVRPEFVQAQTGLMQGAAGVGIWFVKRHQLRNSKRLLTDRPFTPY